jgi:hypothetical protein
MLIHVKTQQRVNPQVNINVDLAVVGGGLSGTCCAIMAARKGIKVALIQDRPVLGGNASSEIRVWALGATSHMGNNNRWAREGGLIDEIMVENMHRNKEGNPVFFDMLLMDKVLAEPNITLLLNTTVNEVHKADDRNIASVNAFNSQNSTSYIIEAKLFADASGDGIVGYLSGASFRFGAEEAEEFHEGFSPSENYGQLLGHTIFLYPKKTDKPVKYVAPDFTLKDTKAIPKIHQINPDQSGCNYWWFEYGGNMDTIGDTEKIKYELWEIVYGAWNHIKNSGLYPEAENMTLEWVGVIPGKRESRRFEGLYMMTQHDIVDQTVFDDGIAYGGWAIDLHPADGVYSQLPSCNQFHAKGIYSIPYRSYVCKDIDNLYILGRLISVSHVAFGSTRVMITCALGGQAIGTAAAMCVKQACKPADILKEGRINQLRQQLSFDGQSIPKLPIRQEYNLAKTAKVNASSTLSLKSLPFSGKWITLDFSRGMLLPLKAGTAYKISFMVTSGKDTELDVDWMTSSKLGNYTPDVLVERLTMPIYAGTHKLHLQFTKRIEADQYGFFILRRNEDVSVGLSNYRMTGALAVANRFNLAVNNRGKQLPPENSGFESFEFFTPGRRPGGENLAFDITPALQCYSVNNLTNGYVRPYISSNAWLAEFEKVDAGLSWTWDEAQTIHQVRLFFDNDADHPMETIQWNHPESHMPFCVAQFALYDENDKCLYRTTDNHQTICDIKFSNPVKTKRLRLELKQYLANIPIALFETEIR